jgi:hypothetical protein
MGVFRGWSDAYDGRTIRGMGDKLARWIDPYDATNPFYGRYALAYLALWLAYGALPIAALVLVGLLVF